MRAISWRDGWSVGAARLGAAIGLVSCVAVGGAHAQCDPVVLSHVGGRPEALAVRNDIGYVAYPGDLRIVDVSNPTAPVLLGSVLTPGQANKVDLGQTHLGMACGDAGLVIVDISSPAAPVVRSVVAMESADDVAISNQKAFVVDRIDLKIVDISAPASPIVYSIPQFPSSGFAQAVASNGNTLYLAGTSEVEILDASTPSAPTLLGTYEPSTLVTSMEYRDGVLAIATFDGVELVDVSNPAAPALLSSIFVDTIVDTVAIEEDGGVTMLYFESDFCEVSAYDITNPATPILRSVVEVCPHDLDANGDDLFVVDGVGITAVDYSTPTSPAIVHTAERLPNFPRGVGVVGGVGGHAIVVDQEQLMVYDIATPAAPVLAATVPLAGFGQDLALVGTTAFVPQSANAGTAMLEIFNVSNPTAPALIGSVATPDTLLDIAVAGDFAYVVTINEVLQVVDVADPAAPALRGSVAIGGFNSEGVAAWDRYAFVADLSTGLHTIDVSDPDAPQVIATIPTRFGQSVYGFAMRDRFAAIGQSDDVVDIYDMADPLNPVRVGGFTAFSFITALNFVDSLLVVSSGPDELHFVDAADPAAPVLIGSLATGGYPDAFAAEGGRVWATGAGGGLWGIKGPGESRLTSLPQDVQICPGDDAVFSVAGVSSAGPPTFQWRRNGVNLVNGVTGTGSTISGALSATLTVADPALGDLGNYDCVVTNGCGSVTTGDARLTAALPPIVLQQPQDDAVCPTGEATFTLAGIGTIPFTYQWEAESPLGSGTFVPLVDHTTTRLIIEGATSRTLTIASNNGNPFPPEVATNYRCIVTNQCDTVTSDAAALILCSVDRDCSDSVDVFDLLDYLDAWFPGDPAADIDGAAGVDVFDLLAYLDGWFAGC